MARRPGGLRAAADGREKINYYYILTFTFSKFTFNNFGSMGMKTSGNHIGDMFSNSYTR